MARPSSSESQVARAFSRLIISDTQGGRALRGRALRPQSCSQRKEPKISPCHAALPRHTCRGNAHAPRLLGRRTMQRCREAAVGEFLHNGPNPANPGVAAKSLKCLTPVLPLAHMLINRGDLPIHQQSCVRAFLAHVQAPDIFKFNRWCCILSGKLPK